MANAASAPTPRVLPLIDTGATSARRRRRRSLANLSCMGHCAPSAALVGHAVVGWAVCGGTIAFGRQILSMATTLLVHAIVAPLVFAFLSMHFFRRYPAASPLRTSLGFVGIVVALDAFVVAPLIERSYAMFTSPLGTWIPFASIWLSSLLVGEAWQQRQARASTANATRVIE